MSDHETTLREIGAEELRKLESLPSVTGQPPKSEAAVRFRARHAACLAGADALRRGTWQPIASAPKDGTEVLVFDANWCGRIPNRTVSYYTWHKDGGGSWSGVTVATHWMPLPDAPTEPTR